MQTIDQPARRIGDAERPLWIGQTPGAWGDVLRTIDLDEVHDAAAMIAAAGLDWRVEQHPLEAVIGREYQSLRVAVPTPTSFSQRSPSGWMSRFQSSAGVGIRAAGSRPTRK